MHSGRLWALSVRKELIVKFKIKISLLFKQIRHNIKDIPMLEIPLPHNLCRVLKSAVRSRPSSSLDSPHPNLQQQTKQVTTETFNQNQVTSIDLLS